MVASRPVLSEEEVAASIEKGKRKFLEDQAERKREQYLIAQVHEAIEHEEKTGVWLDSSCFADRGEFDDSYEQYHRDNTGKVGICGKDSFDERCEVETDFFEKNYSSKSDENDNALTNTNRNILPASILNQEGSGKTPIIKTDSLTTIESDLKKNFVACSGGNIVTASATNIAKKIGKGMIPSGPPKYPKSLFLAFIQDLIQSAIENSHGEKSLYHDKAQWDLKTKFSNAGWKWDMKIINNQRYRVFLGYDNETRKKLRQYGWLFDLAGLPGTETGTKLATSFAVIIKEKPLYFENPGLENEIARYYPMNGKALFILTSKFDPKKWEESILNSSDSWLYNLKEGIDYKYEMMRFYQPEPQYKPVESINDIFEHIREKEKRKKEEKIRQEEKDTWK